MSAAKKKAYLSIFPPIPYAQIKMCKVGRRKVRTIEEVVLAEFIMEGEDAELMKKCILKVNPTISSIGSRSGIRFSIEKGESLAKWYNFVRDEYQQIKKKP